MNRLHTILAQIVAGALVLLAESAKCQVLYEDAASFVGNFNNGNGILGNQVSLPGKFESYMITKFVFQFDFTGIAPALHLRNLSSNSVQISWAATSPDSQLFSTTNLKPPVNWSPVTNPPSESNGLFYISIAATNTGQFFRLSPAPNGNETADLRFYRNDGNPVSPSSNATPGTIIFDSGTFGIGGFTQASLVTFRQEDLFGGVVVPQNFTWAVTYSGLSPNEDAGLAIYGTAKVGTNYGSVWISNGAGWRLLTGGIGSPAPNFGAVAYGTPLPELQSSSKDGSLVLSWPTNITGFSVEMTTNLLGPVTWVPVTNAAVVGGQNVFSNAASGDGAFFRLFNNTLPTY